MLSYRITYENKNNEFWYGDNFKIKNALTEQIPDVAIEVRLKKLFLPIR
jgi:hypothetical protein